VVILGLHGAMVAHGYDDCEGDLLASVRAIVGRETVIGAELDPHCHMTDAKVANADILICFKEFPHTDFVERAEELVTLCLAAARRKIRPVMSVYDCRMIASFPTSREPMRGFVDKIKSLEGRDGVLSISVAHCFPYADVPEVGAKIVVVTDNQPEVGARLAKSLGEELFTMRGKTSPPFEEPDAAITRALANNRPQPVVMADPSDNPGGGAPGDSTVILRRLIERKVEGAAVGPLWDPIAVRFCFAAVRIGGVDVVLISDRTQGFGPDLFGNCGIDPATRRILVVKSTNHFHAGFAPIAADVLYVDSQGPIPRDMRKVPYTRIRRPIWPLDENPHGTAPRP
jgi:microcystin degradation protein MlrC